MYVDDMIAKSRPEEDHLVNLKKLFDRLRKAAFESGQVYVRSEPNRGNCWVSLSVNEESKLTPIK